MKKILFSTLTLTLMSGFTLGMTRRNMTPATPVAPVAVVPVVPAAAPVVPTAPIAVTPVVPALAVKQATVLTEPALITRLELMKEIIEANESDLDKKVAQLEAFADSFDKFKKSSAFMSPDELAKINATIEETMKDIDATIVSAQEWSILPDGPQVSKLKEIKRRIHSKAKDYTSTWEFGRTLNVYAHSFWKPVLTVLTAATAVGLYSRTR